MLVNQSKFNKWIIVQVILTFVLAAVITAGTVAFIDAAAKEVSNNGLKGTLVELWEGPQTNKAVE